MSSQEKNLCNYLQNKQWICINNLNISQPDKTALRYHFWPQHGSVIFIQGTSININAADNYL